MFCILGFCILTTSYTNQTGFAKDQLFQDNIEALTPAESTVSYCEKGMGHCIRDGKAKPGLKFYD